jgi:hypothetical protein
VDDHAAAARRTAVSPRWWRNEMGDRQAKFEPATQFRR